jgi:hypothetical protein
MKREAENMADHRPASIVIDNYNYGQFLREAINSALAQTYAHTEVIVVDDGSTVNSREIIAGYGDQIIPVLKDNGGLASAVNMGLKASRGEGVIFLDSDDAVFPTAVERMMEAFHDPNLSKVHWNMRVAEANGELRSSTVRGRLGAGDLRESVLKAGADGYTWPQLSGNGWSRRFLEKVFPVPEIEIGARVDRYLSTLAPLYGLVSVIEEPQGFWRHHASNHSATQPFEADLYQGVACAECSLQTLEKHARALGLPVDAGELRHNSRWHQMRVALELIKTIVPIGNALILVDQNHWQAGESLAGRQRFQWGYPVDDDMAIRELERLRATGAKFIIFVWPYFWWLDHYVGLHNYLLSNYKISHKDDRLIAFDLRVVF